MKCFIRPVSDGTVTRVEGRCSTKPCETRTHTLRGRLEIGVEPISIQIRQCLAHAGVGSLEAGGMAGLTAESRPRGCGKLANTRERSVGLLVSPTRVWEAKTGGALSADPAGV